MREILFRGKFILNGEWVYGNLIHSKRFEGCFNEWRIYNQDTGMESDIDPSTVGQYTGLDDKDGRQIFEGDILRVPGQKASKVIVVYEDGGFSTGYYMDNGAFMSLWYLHTCIDDGDCEVIGNVHDNPELMEAK